MPFEPSEPVPPELEGARDTGPCANPAARRGVISNVLTPALKLWVRSQLDSIQALEIEVQASNGQLLKGQVPQVLVEASQAIYRGIHLTQATLRAEGIRTNLSQVLRGKPLQLLAAFPINGQVRLDAAALNASLASPLLGNAVIQFLLDLLGEELRESGETISLHSPQVKLGQDQLTLVAQLQSVSGQSTPVAVRSGLRVVNGSQIQLVKPQWLPHPTARQGLPLSDLDGYTLDLGPQTEIAQLQLTPEGLCCEGKVVVMPG
jgi:hypothetical protein